MALASMFGSPRAAYVHVPFCRRRCGYCNFTVVAGRNDLQNRYLDAIENELASSLTTRYDVDTLFIGGGTPTELSTPNLQQLCRLILKWFELSDPYEWSIEANPTDLDPRKLDAIAEIGINRISLGAQSFDERKLCFLERDHQRAEIETSFHLANERFRTVSLDLMFAVPGESLNDWSEDIKAALSLAPDHLSVYGLTLEKGSSYWSRFTKGTLEQVDQEEQREMYELAIDILVAAGYEHYEVSNFARPGHRCLHNLTYWKGDPYFAFGPGAARFVDGSRESNHCSTLTYLRRVLSGQSPVVEHEELTPEQRAREQLVFTLRMIDGISRQTFLERTGFRIDELVADALSEFIALGFLDDDGDRVRLTREGLLISDSLWPAFL